MWILPPQENLGTVLENKFHANFIINRVSHLDLCQPLKRIILTILSTKRCDQNNFCFDVIHVLQWFICYSSHISFVNLRWFLTEGSTDARFIHWSECQYFFRYFNPFIKNPSLYFRQDSLINFVFTFFRENFLQFLRELIVINSPIYPVLDMPNTTQSIILPIHLFYRSVSTDHHCSNFICHCKGFALKVCSKILPS